MLTGEDTFGILAPDPVDCTEFSLTNMILDEIYATQNVMDDFNGVIPDEWDIDTILHATYQGNTFIGSILYSSDIVTEVRLKKRKLGDFNWQTIFARKINNDDNFGVLHYDYYEPSNTKIEYGYFVVKYGLTEELVTTSVVDSKFDHYFICDADVSYPIIANISNAVTYNRESAIVTSPGRKYPYVINNGISGYYSGTLTALLAPVTGREFNVEEGWKFRNMLDEWLSNGQAKVLKSFEGDVWLVNIVNSIPRTAGDRYDLCETTIEWVECGDVNRSSDLYSHGLINTDYEG